MLIVERTHDMAVRKETVHVRQCDKSFVEQVVNIKVLISTPRKLLRHVCVNERESKRSTNFFRKHFFGSPRRRKTNGIFRFDIKFQSCDDQIP